MKHSLKNRHHKYTDVNKQERKKKKVRFETNHKPEGLLTDGLKSDSGKLAIRIGFRYHYSNPTILTYLPPNCIVIYDDCSHKTFRIYNKKKRRYLCLHSC